ncbi:MAG: biotin--[acetyl-CoA-carboxylase] ligase [Pseudomonadota bacterium]
MSDWPDSWGRIALATTDSTNAAARRLAMEGQPLPFWVSAAVQTAARARRGRAWIGGEGNLACSAALRPGQSPAGAALRSFAASVALAEALERLGVSPARIALKWPNDVLLDGGKLAGILLESSPLKGALLLVVGVGVNLAVAPDCNDVEPGALVPAALPTVTASELLPPLARRFDHWNTRLTVEGFAPLRSAWLARATRLGTRIEARLPGQTLSGIFETVDGQGALVLDTAMGRQHLAAADVFF